MTTFDAHAQAVDQLRRKIREYYLSSSPKTHLSLRYQKGHSNTTRTKSYKNSNHRLDLSSLDHIIKVDVQKQTAQVEPRVTMEQLVKATLPFGLVPKIVPEFKGITVGGAIMGAAAESTAHKWGVFNDICTGYEIISGDGTLLTASSQENRDIYYGIAGSYGSFGTLVSADVSLEKAKSYVKLKYHIFSSPRKAIELIRHLSRMESSPEFIDGIVFSKDLAVIIEGTMQDRADHGIPFFSLKPLHAEWYYQHVKNIGIHSDKQVQEEMMTLEDYLFRFDQGAFWMGSYLFDTHLTTRLIGEGILKLMKNKTITEDEIKKSSAITGPSSFWRFILHPIMRSQYLWGILHKAEEWVQERIIIQDFCIPESKAATFLEESLTDPGTFPLWLCPIKGTTTPQIFSPHLLTGENKDPLFINIGIYGLPSYYAPIRDVTRKLERRTKESLGRKVLYSRSYYEPDEFWEIYSRKDYESLRAKTFAKGVWNEITDKVLSI